MKSQEFDKTCYEQLECTDIKFFDSTHFAIRYENFVAFWELGNEICLKVFDTWSSNDKKLLICNGDLIQVYKNNQTAILNFRGEVKHTLNKDYPKEKVIIDITIEDTKIICAFNDASIDIWDYKQFICTHIFKHRIKALCKLENNDILIKTEDYIIFMENKRKITTLNSGDKIFVLKNGRVIIGYQSCLFVLK